MSFCNQARVSGRELLLQSDRIFTANPVSTVPQDAMSSGPANRLGENPRVYPELLLMNSTSNYRIVERACASRRMGEDPAARVGYYWHRSDVRLLD